MVLEKDGSIVRELKYCTKPRRRGITYIQYKEKTAKWIGHILRRNCLLKHVIEVKIVGLVD